MKILVGIPTYDRRVDIELFKILINIERKNKYDLDFLFPVSSHLCRNRNFVCREALNEKHDAVLFLDSDIGITDVDFIDKMVETGYKYDAKIIGGAYRMKKSDLTEFVYIAGNFKDGRMDNLRDKNLSTGLVEAVGTGIMLIFRDVLEKMPDPWFTIIDKPNLDVMPEDFEFCRKARELGYNVALDTRFSTNHWGNYSFRHE